MKRCSKCKQIKDESEFSKNRSRQDGLRVWCKKCESEYAHKRYKKNRGPLKKYFRYEDRHRVVNGVEEKRCRRCKQWKPQSRFYRNRKHRDGLAVWCKECSDKATNKCRNLRIAILKKRSLIIGSDTKQQEA